MKTKPTPPTPSADTLFGANWKGRRCGARAKSTGQPCQSPAMRNGRCQMHGGRSTGIKTPEGRERQRMAVTKMGLYAGWNNPISGPLPGPRYRDPELVEIRRGWWKAMRDLRRGYRKD